VVRTYQRAIETKDLALYRSVRPRLSPEAESTLRQTFRDQANQEVEIRIDSVRVDGRTATARVTQRVTLVDSGRRHTENSALTLRFEKTETGWIIAN